MLSRLTKIGNFRQLMPGVQNRFVVFPHELRAQSPFVLLVEDIIEPDATAFGMHPHRGFETVTLLLAGSERAEDHLGANEVLHAGDVQWTTAGSGIFHGGGPIGTERLHALQLWLNLPRALKGAAPGTRIQRLAKTPVVETIGAHVVVHAGTQGDAAHPHLSQWPLTMVQAVLRGDGETALELQPQRTAFLYVLRGAVSLGAARVGAGEVGWIAPMDRVSPMPVRADDPAGAHFVFYAAPGFDEPVVAQGPFVMSSDEEIGQAYRDLEAGTLTS